ncbi:hypothetical protein Enr13x_76970 [Stieleria neptunia]|uniref:Uncharacterized protein n=1 Tax=Stieleria neptunia TaxID=2527979 RepID=A0A518I3V8_9BACT|nr:DUF4175 family protein [Stieleria neptunia]QDV47785.1 hypothetical protein Enr13x_76970 [Stieleria neptunia]
MNAPDVAFQVARQFTALRRRYLTVRLATVVSLAVVFLLAVWLLLGMIDYRWEWPQHWRTSTILTAVGIAGVLLLWQAVWLFRQTRQRPFAGTVERSFEDFGQRIRTVLDTVDGRVHGPEEMLTALGNQTLGRWESVTPSRLVPVRSLWLTVLACAATAALLLGLFTAGGDWRLAILRAIGIDRPYTRLQVTPGDVALLEGTPVDVSLELIGRTDRDVLLRYRELRATEPGALETDSLPSPEAEQSVAAEPEWIESEILADSPPTDDRRQTFRTNLGKATWPIEYQFVSSGQTTPIHRIGVQPLIETERVEITVQPPEYTGLQPRVFSKPDLTVLERSLVTVTIELNHPLKEAILETGPKTSQLSPTPLESPADRTRWSFPLPADQTVRWRFSGSGADGTPMEPVTGRLGIRRDAAPSISWREPSDEIRVHTLAEVPLGVQVSDDYGIIEAGIAFQLGGDDEYVLTDWTPQSEAEAEAETESLGEKTRLMLAELLPLESFELSERDYIAYYAYAVDNRPWGNHRSESDVRYIDIRPLRQFYQEIDPPGGNQGAGSRVLVRLDEIIRRERFVINRTRKLVRGGTDMAAQLGTIDRLVENQSELADLTRFLAEFFISRGNDDVEALNQAEAAMLQASDSLAAGSLDLALVQEEEALRSLAEARRTLEIILTKRMSRAQQQALRRLARQLQQKLRRDRPETERELADSLKQIASQQRSLAAAAQRSMSSSQSAGQGQSGSPRRASDAQRDGNSDSETDNETDSETETAADTPAAAAESADGEQADGEQTDGEQTDGEQADGEQADEGQQSMAEDDSPTAQETLYEQQIELLERLDAIREPLAERLAESDLMTRRMDEAQAGMDDLATRAREGEFESMAAGGRTVSDLIEELGLQLEALSAAEPVTRVSSLRDLTSGLAGMEHQLASNNPPSPRGGGDTMTPEQENRTERLAQRMAARSETLEEVISSQADIGDIEMSEVNDQLQNFAEETRFLEQLESTLSAAGQVRDAEGKTDESVAADAMERAVEYAAAANRLERLYQQLVTPRLARLRRMEQQANQLANQMGGNPGRGENSEPETERALRDLKQDLREESLRELAEMLEGGQAEDSDPTQQEGSRDGVMTGELEAGGGLTFRNRDAASERVRMVADELRKRIQHVMLLEIAVDRQTPIPSEYRDAVDGYFKTLARENPLEMESAAGGESR